MEEDFPRLISADDHVLEPPRLWHDRLPQKLQDVGPRVQRERVDFKFEDVSSLSFKAEPSEDGVWADVWYYEDKREPVLMNAAAVGFDLAQRRVRPVIFDEVRRGCYDPAARLCDMDVAGIEASLCFPNLVPVRFCGQGFLQTADKELALLCVRAYNDFIIDEWCAGSRGRLIPLGIIPLWDVGLAAQEVRQLAVRGNRAICFSEAPARLGLPSIHSGEWEPFFEACEETKTVIMLHIGSSSYVPLPSADAPFAEANLLITLNAMTAMLDWLYSGIFIKHPDLKVCLAECQIGWIPYFLQRADESWEVHEASSGSHDTLPIPPSQLFASNMFATFFSDVVGLKNVDAIGLSNVLVEADYPHTDSTWPSSQALLRKQIKAAGIDNPGAIEKIARDNARQLFRLEI